MSVTSIYLRHREEVKFTAVLIGMVAAGALLADMLGRAISGSPLKVTIYYLIRPFGLNAAAPGGVLFGAYLTGLVLLVIDRTKRPQSVFLIVVTLLGSAAMALRGQFFTHLSTGSVALVALGVVAAVFYVGPKTLSRISITDPNESDSPRLTTSGNGRLEFRSAERLLFGLLVFVVVVAFFEAHTQYQPLLGPNLRPNLGALGSFRLSGTAGSRLAIDFASSGVFLAMLYLFLGYDAEKTYFIVGPKRSGKTHAAIALHEEAEEHGYNPRDEANDLLQLETDLVEGDGWAEATNNKTQDLSFSFTSRGLFRKNIQLEARDYPGELVRAILPALRYHREPEDELVAEYPNIQTREQWLQQKVKESQEKDGAFGRGSTVADGGTREDRSSDESAVSTSTTETATDAGIADEAFVEQGADESVGNATDDTDVATTRDDDRTNGTEDGRPSSEARSSLEVQLVVDEILPAFVRADTLLLIVDLQKHLADESVGADVLYKIFDQSEKDAIILATKADLLAEEFADSHGWRSAWTEEAYDEFRTYVESELSEHNVLARLLGRVERPYPVGYQTVKPEGPDGEGEELDREIDRRTGLGKKRIQVHGYEYVLERLN